MQQFKKKGIMSCTRNEDSRSDTRKNRRYASSNNLAVLFIVPCIQIHALSHRHACSTPVASYTIILTDTRCLNCKLIELHKTADIGLHYTASIQHDMRYS